MQDDRNVQILFSYQFSVIDRRNEINGVTLSRVKFK